MMVGGPPRPDTSIAPGALLRLMALVSPALPIGSFAYSQGLEQAVAMGWVHDEASAEAWIVGLAAESLARVEVPLLARLYRAFSERDDRCVRAWNGRLWAMRATRETRAEETDLGRALARVLASLGIEDAAPWIADVKATHLALFALASVRFAVPLEPAALGYVFSRTESQTSAAARLVPLGQSAAQRILAVAAQTIPASVERGLLLDDDDIGFSAIGQSIASSGHERLYSRLFRS
jgi:urease accessory protein